MSVAVDGEASPGALDAERKGDPDGSSGGITIAAAGCIDGHVHTGRETERGILRHRITVANSPTAQ